MSKEYSRYGSYFLREADDIPGLVVKAKSINRKRHDFVTDTDPENFADNIDDTLPEDEMAPEGFPMGDISDIPDEVSDSIPQFPEDNLDDDIEDFPDDTEGDLDNEPFPDDKTYSGDIPEFPIDDNKQKDDITQDEGMAFSVNSVDANLGDDGHDSIIDDINKKFTDKGMPTPDEIIDNLKKQVYSDNTPDATQNNINNSEIPEFPEDNTNSEENIPEFPTDEINPMGQTQDEFPAFPDDTGNTAGNEIPPVDNAAPGTTPDAGVTPPFPGDETQPGGEVITADGTGDMGTGTDFTNGADGGPAIPEGAPQQNPGPGVGYDSMRKYNLYKEYDKLLNAITNYISKLEGILFDEPHQNMIIKIATDKLNEVKQLCYDYITMKFEIATYAQACTFFEELSVAIQVIFSILMTISSYNDIDDSKTKKKPKAKK